LVIITIFLEFDWVTIMIALQNFCPYKISLDDFREARRNFEVEEWMGILLGAIDYNPDGFARNGWIDRDIWKAKHTMLTRLLPFIQPRVNLIELAPQQTGKSYMVGKISKYGWLLTGGQVSRTMLFIDRRPGARTKGLVTCNDFIAVDEIKSIEFANDKEMAGILKGYMEDGYVTVGGTRIDGDAGTVRTTAGSGGHVAGGWRGSRRRGLAVTGEALQWIDGRW
jgi:ATP-dependent Lon protease